MYSTLIFNFDQRLTKRSLVLSLVLRPRRAPHPLPSTAITRPSTNLFVPYEIRKSFIHGNAMDSTVSYLTFVVLLPIYSSIHVKSKISQTSNSPTFLIDPPLTASRPVLPFAEFSADTDTSTKDNDATNQRITNLNFDKMVIPWIFVQLRARALACYSPVSSSTSNSPLPPIY
jgi:hypothetical protein